MRQISPDASPQVVLSHLRVLTNRLSARPDTTALSSPVADARDVLKSGHDRWQELHDLRVSSTGALAFADAQEDGGVARVARQVGVMVDGKRTDARYLRLFERAPSTLTKGVADEEQARFVEHLIETIRDNNDYTTLRGFLPELVSVRGDVVGAAVAQQSALRAEETAWNEVQLAEKAAREVYRDTVPALELLFPGNKRLVDSFYPAAKR